MATYLQPTTSSLAQHLHIPTGSLPFIIRGIYRCSEEQAEKLSNFFKDFSKGSTKNLWLSSAPEDIEKRRALIESWKKSLKVKKQKRKTGANLFIHPAIINGVAVNVHVVYSLTGVKESVTPYNLDGQKHGVANCFSGSHRRYIQSQITYQNGLKHGKSILRERGKYITKYYILDSKTNKTNWEQYNQQKTHKTI